MANYKPVILVNKTNSALIFETLVETKDYRTVLVADESGRQIPAAEEFKYHTPRGGRTIEVPATLPQAGVTGYVVLTKKAWTDLTSKGTGYEDFVDRYTGRKGDLDVLDEASDVNQFVKDHEIIVDKEIVV